MREHLETGKNELIVLHENHTKLTDELVRLRIRSANRMSVTAELQSTAENCERLVKLAKAVRRSESSSSAPSTAVCLALLAKWGQPKRRCNEVALDIQGIPGLVNEAIELRAKVADSDKVNT